jgi:hypothetical protein
VIPTLEATVPCRLELLGRPWSSESKDGARRLAIALDRRVFCRIEPRPGGVEIHSKDSGERVVAEHARDIARGPAAPVARLLEAAGIDSGIRVVTQVRVPEDAGLGAAGALRVAILAALGRSVGEIRDRTDSMVADSGSELPPSDLHAALFGGALVCRVRGGKAMVERLLADPARLEECLLLVDPDSGDLQASPGPTDDLGAASRVVEAIAAGAYEEVAAILSEVHRGRFDNAPPAAKSASAAIVRAGGAAWPSGRLIAVWAAPGARSPGPREAVRALLTAAGLRVFPARVDLRGLEVE